MTTPDKATHISEEEDYATAIFIKYVAGNLVCNIVYWTGLAWSNDRKTISTGGGSV